MKKNFIKKGVSVLGTVLLLASVVLPGISAYAYSDDTWMWDYVWNEDTWNASNTDGALKVYYQNNPSEDLWCNDHKATRDDAVYSALLCSDSQCSESTEVSLTTVHGNNYQVVTNQTNQNESYYLTNDAKVGNIIYQLYSSINHCSIDDNHDSILSQFLNAEFPNGWTSDGLCQYGVPGTYVNEVCTVPQGLPNGSEPNPYITDRCLINVYGEIIPVSANKYVKLLSSSYPNCQPTYQGWIANGVQAPWISVAFKQEFKGTIKFNYTDYQNGADVYPRGDEAKIWGPDGKVWAVASIPGTFGNEYGVNSGQTSFVLSGFTVTLVSVMSDPTGCVETPDGETFTGVILEPEEPVLSPNEETSITTLVASNNSTAAMEGVVELNVFKDMDGDGAKDSGDDLLTGQKVNFTSPVLVRIPVNTTGDVFIKVRHNGETTFSTDGLTTSSTGTCTSGVATPAYVEGTPITPTSGYAEIYTCSASTFVAYTETANNTPSYGGSSSSYSCKNLPANAVANNSSKPSKNTDYSYSTNTGAVCTFQCKTGYTWNADKKICEVADESNTGDDTIEDTNTDNLDPKEVLANGFTREFNDAYEFAFANGITTMKSIQEANMEGSLTRIAMAKMLSQYAINVLGKTPDTNKKCEFGDVSAELDAQYNNGVTLACQLGIMGVGITDFRPNDDVIRAEFGTALSRLLFGLTDGTDHYYTTHLAKLKAEGIIQNDDPKLEELRGYVMLMLMRSAK